MPVQRASRGGGDTDASPPLIPPDDIIKQIQRLIIAWGIKNYKEFPWRKPDKPWHALIGEILLQRTKAASVVPVYTKFLERFSSLEILGEASVSDIEQVIYPLGLRWRAPLLKQLGQKLAETGEIPRSLPDLLELPGVGSYVAAAWLGFHGGKRSVIVDANVVRWLCRLIDQPADGETRRKKWLLEMAETFTPDVNWKEYNYALLDFTMEVCAVRPRCDICPIGAKLCLYARKQLTKAEGVDADSG